MARYPWENPIRRISVALSATLHGMIVGLLVFGLPRLLDASVELEVPIPIIVFVSDDTVGYLPPDLMRNLRPKKSDSPGDEGLPPLSGDSAGVVLVGSPDARAGVAEGGNQTDRSASGPATERPTSLAALKELLRRDLEQMQQDIESGSVAPEVLAKEFETAAERGDPGAQYWLAAQYELGLGVPTDAERSAAWYREAAENRMVAAQVRLGTLLATGEDDPESRIEAQAWLSLAAETGDPVAVAGRDLLARELTPRELGEASRQTEEIKRVWEMQDYPTQAGLTSPEGAGGSPTTGTRPEPSQSAAMPASQSQASEPASSEPAQSAMLVPAAQTEEGGGADASEAEAPSRDTADEPSEPSEPIADWVPERPESLAELEAILRRLLEEARQQLEASATPPEALAEQLRTAAEQGNVEAQYQIAMQYELGLGVPKDLSEAVAWHRTAAEKQFVDAQVRLGYLLATGEGDATSMIEAKVWWSIAAETGEPLAAAGHDLLARELTPREIAEANRQAENIRRTWRSWQRWAADNIGAEVTAELFEAARTGDVDRLKELLDMGLNPNARDSRQTTALHYGAMNGHGDVSETLVRRGANVNLADGAGKTALMWASEEGQITVAKVLLKRGADINAQDKFGQTALINAAWRGRNSIVNILLSLAADPNAKAGDGNTPLLWAAINGYAAVARLLVDFGASIDDADIEGVTPLMRAAWNGHADTVAALIESGADLNVRSKKGRTALRLARENFYKDIVAILREAGATR